MSTIYDLNGCPSLGQAIPTGLQHVLALMVGNVAPILLVAASLGLGEAQSGYLIQCSFLVAGIITFLQVNAIGPVGARLPVMMGTSFTYLAVSISIGAKYGMSGIIGAILIGGGAQILIALFIPSFKRFFPPLVTGCIVMCLGLTLIPTGIDYFAGGIDSPAYGSINNLLLGSISLLIIVALQIFTKGIMNIAAILTGIVAGYLLAIPMGLADFSAVSKAAWFSMPKPLLFGVTFHVDAIVPMVILCLITSIQSIGNLSATAMSGLNRPLATRELRGGLLAEGIGSLFCGLFNALPATTYAQNVGIVAITKAVNRFVFSIAAIILIICGFMPKLSALILAMPASVLGGAAILLFASVATTGMQMIAKEGFNNRAAIITALSVGLGVGFFLKPAIFDGYPELAGILLTAGLPLTAVIAFLLNLLIKPSKNI
jgi:NCS2 family nucleobase:cation symporter-2